MYLEVANAKMERISLKLQSHSIKKEKYVSNALHIAYFVILNKNVNHAALSIS